jgi:ribosome assembly protein SQT1
LAYIFSPIPSPASDESTSTSSFNADTYSSTALTGHTDSVVATGWNFDGEMVATGGMDGRVRVWRRVKGKKGVQGETENGVDAWKNWEFLTSLETGSEVQVSAIVHTS